MKRTTATKVTLTVMGGTAIGSAFLAGLSMWLLVTQPMMVAAAVTEHRFGYTIFEPSKKGKHWNATFFDTTGKAKVVCEVEPTKATCDKQ